MPEASETFPVVVFTGGPTIEAQVLRFDVMIDLARFAECVVLDAGCGTSNLSVRLEKLGADVIGTDYSLEGLRIGRSKSPGIKLLQNDLNINLPFKDCSFDKVVSCNTLYLLPSENLTSVFNEFYRVLKPGGKVVITNLTRDFRPYKIYFNHIRKFSNKYGFLKTIISIFGLIIPTVRMFYYGSYIQKSCN